MLSKLLDTRSAYKNQLYSYIPADTTVKKFKIYYLQKHNKYELNYNETKMYKTSREKYILISNINKDLN